MSRAPDIVARMLLAGGRQAQVGLGDELTGEPKLQLRFAHPRIGDFCFVCLRIMRLRMPRSSLFTSCVAWETIAHGDHARSQLPASHRQ